MLDGVDAACLLKSPSNVSVATKPLSDPRTVVYYIEQPRNVHATGMVASAALIATVSSIPSGDTLEVFDFRGTHGGNAAMFLSVTMQPNTLDYTVQLDGTNTGGYTILDEHIQFEWEVIRDRLVLDNPTTVVLQPGYEVNLRIRLEVHPGTYLYTTVLSR